MEFCELQSKTLYREWKVKKARFKEIRPNSSVASIRVVNIRRNRFAPDPRQLKNISADLKNPTDPAQY